jgi:ubiquinol-cytochrome c reductase cytochrome c1 subunit
MMIRSLALASLLALAAPAFAEEAGHVEDVAFSFEGPFGTYDQHQLQRGLQVYTEVCAGCHGLKYVPLRQLEDLGYSPAEVRAYAGQFTVVDKETGEERAAIPADHFAANTAAGAPDLSLMAKARAGFHGPHGLGVNQLVKGMGGPEYIVAILTGYTGEEKTEAGSTFYENKIFPGGWISMSPPLSDGQVTFADGHPNDVHHMAEDVAAFLMWSAEPHLEARKQSGFVGVLFLALLATLFYLTNKRIWAGIKGRKQA